MGRSPHSPDVQTEIKALLALQGLLRDKHRTLPQEQLMAVRNQVDHLAVKYRVSFARPSVAHAPSIPATPYHAPMQQQQQQPPQPHLVAPAPPASAPPASVSLDALLGKGALAALLSRQSATPQPAPTPPPPQVPPTAVSALRSPPPQRAEPAKPATPDPMALLASLRSRGLLPATPQPGQTQVAPSFAQAPPPPASAPAAAPAVPAFPPNLASILAQARNIAASAAAAVPIVSSGEFSFKASSLQQYVLYLDVHTSLGRTFTYCCPLKVANVHLQAHWGPVSCLTLLLFLDRGYITSHLCMRRSAPHVPSAAGGFIPTKKARRRRRHIWTGTFVYTSV